MANFAVASLGATSVPSTIRSAATSASLSGIFLSSGVALWMIKPVGDLRLVVFGYVLVLLGCIIGGLASGFWMDKQLFGFAIASLVVGSVGTIIGIANSNPGVNSEMVFFIVLPATWMFLTWGYDLTAVRTLINITPFIGLLIGVLGCFYWLDATGKGTFSWVFLIDLGQGIGSRDYGYQMRFYPISTLVFIQPFLIMSLVIRDTYTWAKSRLLAFPATLTTLGVLFVAGRRILFLTLVLSLAIGFFIFLRKPGARKARIRMYAGGAVAAAFGFFAASYTGFSLQKLVVSVLEEGASSESVRTKSANDLIDSWQSSPLFGHGWGATLEIPRSIDRPWDFEVQYHLILNATGLFGLSILLVITVGLFAKSSKWIKDRPEEFGFLIPVSVGSIAVVIANATNPYMHTAGHYWMFFLMVLGANAMYRSTKNRPPSLQVQQRENFSPQQAESGRLPEMANRT